jgi:hypothetical protein
MEFLSDSRWAEIGPGPGSDEVVRVRRVETGWLVAVVHQRHAEYTMDKKPKVVNEITRSITFVARDDD